MIVIGGGYSVGWVAIAGHSRLSSGKARLLFVIVARSLDLNHDKRPKLRPFGGTDRH